MNVPTPPRVGRRARALHRLFKHHASALCFRPTSDNDETGRSTMPHNHVSRRTMLMGAAALGALAAAPDRLLAQQAAPGSAAAPAAALPPSGEFVIRGANVLTMDPGIADLASGDVHVVDGVIRAVAPRVDAANARVIDGSGMICMPGFVDTHWHLWTSLFRPF